ncbi:hypothetical protein G6F24_015154 [Rhizopus arrhizus]|nr:hypothetical protein G6F24_015154 [Rhizopus arrhizus]
MGLSTFLVGVLPSYASIGLAAPAILIVLRLLQGLALGGEYGGAATYVAEHAPHGRRGFYTSWIQTTATLGLFLSLLVILGIRTVMGEDDFKAWGWRIPFVSSVALHAHQRGAEPVLASIADRGRFAHRFGRAVCVGRRVHVDLRDDGAASVPTHGVDGHHAGRGAECNCRAAVRRAVRQDRP